MYIMQWYDYFIEYFFIINFILVGIWLALWFIFKVGGSLLNVIFDINLDADLGGKIGHNILHFVYIFPIMLCFIFLRFKIQRRNYMSFHYWQFTKIEYKIIEKIGYYIREIEHEYECETLPFGFISGNFIGFIPGGTHTEYRVETIVYKH